MNSDSESLQHQLIALFLAENAQMDEQNLVSCEENERVEILVRKPPP